MADLINSVKNEASTKDWLFGCTMCDEGLCNFIDNLIENKKFKQSQALKLAADMANEKVGAEIFNANALKQKYYRFKGIEPEKKPVTKRTKIKPETKENDKLQGKETEDIEENEVEEVEQSEPDKDSDNDSLCEALAGSVKSVLIGLKQFNEAEEITNESGIKQELAFNLIDMIPEAKKAILRINNSE